MPPKKKKGDTVGYYHAGNSKRCLLCNYEVCSATGIRLHLRLKHNVRYYDNKITSSCYSCGKNFDNYGQLMNHLKKEHY